MKRESTSASAFLASIYRLLGKWEVPTEDIHFEFFGPYDELSRA